MNFILILGIALALAMDAFAVAVGISLGLKKIDRGQIFRLSFHFGLFQLMMPIIGWLAGRSLIKYIQLYDHWIAFGLLSIIAIKMIYDSFRHQEKKESNRPDPTKGLSLIILSVATSIDALAVGISLAAIQVAIIYPAVVIGLVAFLMTVVGLKIGPLLKLIVGKGAEFSGGLILFFIGLKILLEHWQ